MSRPRSPLRTSSQGKDERRAPARVTGGPGHPAAPPAAGRQLHIAARDLQRFLPGSTKRHQELLEAVLFWLELHHIPAVAIHTGPRVTPDGAGGWRLYGNPDQRGFADIFAALPPYGRAVLVELKTGRAHRSAVQRASHARFGAAGVLSLEARSTRDLEALLEKIRADEALLRHARTTLEGA